MEKTTKAKTKKAALPLGRDVDGYDWLTAAIHELVNQFPGPQGWDIGEILFASLEDESGAAFYPGTGAVIESQKTSVTGKVRQVCRYNFAVGVRLGSPYDRVRAELKEWLDSLGRWLEGQRVTVNGEQHELESYPAMSGGRRILGFERLTSSYMEPPEEDRVETWIIALVAKYENVYQKKH